MRKILILIFIFIYTLTNGQTSCATSLPISSGSCISTSFPGSANMAGTCVGGTNPAIYLRFTAGSCSSFNITPSSNASTIGSAIYTYPGCSYVANSAECHDNVVTGNQFNAGANNTTGGYLLTSGQQYVMLLWGPVGTSTFNICYNANVLENSSNECGGSLILGTTATQFYNGNDCSFTGSYTDATTTDPTPSSLCAGSLENTQWITFQPLVGVTSFQIIGSNINCTGGGCGFQFGIFSGSCGSLVSEGCYGNKVCSGGQSVAGPTNVSSTDGFSISWSGTSSTGFTATITKTGGGAFNGSEVFYLVMDGNGDADCTYTLQGINVSVLPIELLEFKGYNEEYYNIIKWSTATEINNHYFILERSTDGVKWDLIYTKNGAGNSNTTELYEYKDYEYQRDVINYYRLSQVDYDGQRKYFNIISIDYKKENTCKEYEYYNLMGGRVNYTEVSPGIYLRKCDDKVEKIIKY